MIHPIERGASGRILTMKIMGKDENGNDSAIQSAPTRGKPGFAIQNFFCQMTLDESLVHDRVDEPRV